MGGEIGNFFETEGQNIGRTKIDSKEAVDNAMMMADEEELVRKLQKEADETGNSQWTDTKRNRYVVQPGGEGLEDQIAVGADRIAKKNIAFEASKDDLERTLPDPDYGNEIAPDFTTGFFQEKAANKARAAYEDYDRLMRDTDKAKIKRLEEKIKSADR